MAHLEQGGLFNSDSGSRQVHTEMEEVRRGFVQKVYGTVAVQLCATAIIAAPIASAPRIWLSQHAGLMMFSVFGLLASSCVFCCAGHLMRQHPTNLIILAAFTCFKSIMVGFICSQYEMQSVILCFLASGIMAGALTFFAATTSMDATKCGGTLGAFSCGLFAFGLIGMYVGGPMMHLLYAGGGAVLFGSYLVHDTQLVLGGKHTSKRFSVDDYVLAALSIYQDLIQFFIMMLRLFGERRRD